MKKFKVTCLKCEHSDNVAITDDKQIMWGQPTYIISGRNRLDGEWGWQCLCGNNSLMSAQERKTIKNHQQPDPRDIQAVIQNLKREKSSFAMEPA